MISLSQWLPICGTSIIYEIENELIDNVARISTCQKRSERSSACLLMLNSRGESAFLTCHTRFSSNDKRTSLDKDYVRHSKKKTKTFPSSFCSDLWIFRSVDSFSIFPNSLDWNWIPQMIRMKASLMSLPWFISITITYTHAIE